MQKTKPVFLMSFTYCSAHERGGWQCESSICISLGTPGRLPGGGDFEGREEFEYSGRQGGDEKVVLQAKGPNSIYKGMEA